MTTCRAWPSHQVRRREGRVLERSTKSIDCVRFSLTNIGMPPSHSIADHLSFSEISTYRCPSYQSGHG